MLDTRDLTHERELALAYAVELNTPAGAGADDGRLLATADAIFEWLTAVDVTVTGGPEKDQTTGSYTGQPGGMNMAAYTDNGKFELTVTAKDTKGQVTASGADVTFTSGDTTIVTIEGPDADGKTWGVCGLPGSTVVTADWPDSPKGDIKGTLAVDVTAGDAASIEVTAGPEVPQAPAPTP